MEGLIFGFYGICITRKGQNPGPKNRWIRISLQLQDPEIR